MPSHFRHIAVATICCAFGLAPVATARAKTKAVGAAAVSDSAMREAVMTELRHTPGVGANALSVDVANGIVTLSGKAAHLLERDRAVLVAMGIRGVRSVVNRVELPAATRKDSEIKTDVVAAITEDPVADSYKVDVEVKNGVVRLSGQVDSSQERLQALRIAKSVIGVRDVADTITVPVRAHRIDSDLRLDIKSALRWDRLLDDDHITVDVDAAKVTLAGTVGSGLEKIRAEHRAYIPGVQSVQNNLAVAPGPRQPVTPKERADIPDAKVATAVRDTLARDPRTDDFAITTSSSGHIVTLSGEVTNLAAKRAAAENARNTVGVVGVVDKLVIAAPPRTDPAIETALYAALKRDPWVGPNAIEVDVVNGVVSLRGRVDTGFEKARADDIATGVRGAQRVDNRLVIADDDKAAYRWEPRIDDWNPARYPWFTRPKGPTAEDATIAAEIRRELRWSPFVDAGDIKVTVRDGTAILDGTVDSPPERAAATENAYEGGAISVVNRLNSRIDI